MLKNMLQKPFFKGIIYTLILFLSLKSFAREQLRIVGSSTLYPFITIVAEKFGKITGHTPVVEATGTGGGIRLLCSGASLNYPDIVNASRRMTPLEEEFCKKNLVDNIKEIQIGYDGIVMAQSSSSIPINLSEEELFFALAKKVPLNNVMVDNPYKNWQEINPAFQNIKIEIYGPSSTSGTRDAFIELAMQNFCEKSEKIKSIIPDQTERLATCSLIREDGTYIEMPENYNLLIQKLLSNKYALSVLSYSFLMSNPEIRAVEIENVAPTKETIINGEYLLARPFYLYINYDHIKELPTLLNFIEFITSPAVIGKDGYLSKNGLIAK